MSSSSSQPSFGPRIERPRLTVEEVVGNPGQRLVRVTYHLVAGPDDEAVGHLAKERVVVMGIELDTDPVAAANDPIATSVKTHLVRAGDHVRRIEQLVHRVLLDVEQDWWTSGSGGETIPIAEWIDHLVAHIQIEIDDDVIAEALTPVVSGSWGPLGTS